MVVSPINFLLRLVRLGDVVSWTVQSSHNQRDSAANMSRVQYQFFWCLSFMHVGDDPDYTNTCAPLFRFLVAFFSISMAMLGMTGGA